MVARNVDGSRAGCSLQPFATAGVHDDRAVWRLGPELLGEPDEDAFGTTDVEGPVDVPVVDDFVDDRCAELLWPDERVIEVLDGEHDAQVLALARHGAADQCSHRVTQAEPDNSGSTTVVMSPGVTLGAGPASTLSAYAQVSVYQKINGIQLAPHSALAIGWTSDF